MYSWLQTLPLDMRAIDAKVAAALRAEQLVRLNNLRQLAARGKLPGALSWISDFEASGEPLVVFAEHVEIQRAVMAPLPDAVHILGADTTFKRQQAVDAFQREDGPQLIVCSMKAASQGITLTRASNVAFLELDWTPARHETRPRTGCTGSARRAPSRPTTSWPRTRSTRPWPRCSSASGALINAVTRTVRSGTRSAWWTPWCASCAAGLCGTCASWLLSSIRTPAPKGGSRVRRGVPMG